MKPPGTRDFGGRAFNYEFMFSMVIGLFRLSISSWLNFISLCFFQQLVLLNCSICEYTVFIVFLYLFNGCSIYNDALGYNTDIGDLYILSIFVCLVRGLSVLLTF